MPIQDTMFSVVYQHSPIGLVIVDSNSELVKVNNYMFNTFRLDPQDYEGKRFGNVFHCSVVSEGDRICGTTEQCAGCNLRSEVTHALVDLATLEDMTVKHSFCIDGVHTQKWFKISASPVTVDDQQVAVVSFVDISREKQLEEILRNDLTLDLATGTINKHSLISTLMDLAKYSLTDQMISVGIVDLDNFKAINDTYGHLVGDEVLLGFSRISREIIRKRDIIGRYGGDEFMFVFPGVPLAQAAGIVERIQSALKAAFQDTIGKGISISAGFVQLDSQHLEGQTKESIIQQVDDLLYTAKAHGKNRFLAEGMELEF